VIWLLVCAVALGASALTLFSGFGLGTLLLPAFALLFPLELAVAATAVVHLANNLFKLTLVGRYARKRWVLAFTLPAIPAAFLGAWLLGKLGAQQEPLFRGEIGPLPIEVSPLPLTIAVLILLFALRDLIPSRKRLTIPRRWIPLGGLLSGFFGGLSGHQGTLRSAFLVHAGLDPKAFVGTGVVCAVAVDLVRLAVYSRRMTDAPWSPETMKLIAFAALCAFLGAWLGAKMLGKVRLEFLHKFIAVMLIITAIAMAFGWV
jgi:uncharacterized membrane protein YfcA